MALADRRPLGLPLGSAHASPAFNPDNLGSPQSSPKLQRKEKGETGALLQNESLEFASEDSLSPTEASPNLRSISPDSLMNSGLVALKKTSSNSSRDLTPPLGSQNGYYNKTDGAVVLGKKQKPASRVPIATGILTTIPVTGEKPKPEQEGDASLEDDVLFAIFLILYEKDVTGQGMTVKQICDVLVERHPEMAQLLSKTSNLVSAKLNAYVKRVEKGDLNLKYALSREWADALPKRMVYVYRGLLAKDFHVHVKHAMDSQKPLPGPMALRSPSFPADSFEAAKQHALLKPRRQTMFDLGINRHAFSEKLEASNLFVPYSLAPVAANMAQQSGLDSNSATEEVQEKLKPEPQTEAETDTPAKLETTPATKKLGIDSDLDFDDLEVFNDTDDDMEFSLDIMRKAGKRSKSMSHLLPNKKAKFVTAAAAAPRVPRTPCSHNPQAAAAAAALHAAALKAIAAATSAPEPERHNSVGACEKAGVSPKSKCNWTHAVRSGFLTEEIGAPEDVSLSDLDKLFG
ncbi:hypothetical protein METSCH_A07530 [Metschnikowia aff. pulcherrima]|uniref:GDS1 winged helix domain-containing protein n=1 Tax=Metschnikowia aff. pulcherrima TaxID=2163413 RepID=A0A4P6XFJ7_9ASCO|nr:hypothetical protein METSCH_A07530 [Metschnikowia aff. pulcherrima]